MDINETNSTFLISSKDSDKILFKNFIEIVVPILFTLILFIGLIGNILVIVALMLTREMRNSTYLLIGNLALADLLFLIFCTPFQIISYTLKTWPFLNAWCRVNTYLNYIAVYVSVWTLVLIAFDRYLAIVFPIRSMHFRTLKNARLSIVILWIIISLANIPVLKEWEVLEYVDSASACVFKGMVSAKSTTLYVQIYFAFWVIFVYMLPLTMTCFLYVCVLRKLWKNVSNLSRRSSLERLETARTVTRLVATVTITFTVCWLPANLCFIYKAITYKQGQRMEFRREFLIIEIVSKILAFANSCANPILYTILSKNFRKGFSQVLRGSALQDARPSRRSSEESEMIELPIQNEKKNYSDFEL